MNTNSAICPDLTYLKEKEYNWDNRLAMLDVDANIKNAQMQNISSFNNENMNSISSQATLLTVPMAVVIFMFLFFVTIMSGIYMYHWNKFGLGDAMLKKFSIFYFIILSLFLVPLIFNLIF